MNKLRELVLRPARADDGRHMWDLVSSIGTLEQNTGYCYLVMARMFAETCCVVEHHGERVGFLLGFSPPERRSSLFVWQIGVLPQLRGSGLATGLLLQGLSQSNAEYIEATVGLTNASSRALFAGFARRLNAPCQVEQCFLPEHFPEPHEAEQLFRIGPIDSRSEAYRKALEPYLDNLTLSTTTKNEVN